jgi:hypothetical protein
MGYESPEFLIEKLRKKGFWVDKTILELIDKKFIRANVNICQLSIGKLTVKDIGTYTNANPTHREVFEQIDDKYFIYDHTTLGIIDKIPLNDFDEGPNVFEHNPILTKEGLYTIAVEKTKDQKGDYKFFLNAMLSSYICLLTDSIFLKY